MADYLSEALAQIQQQSLASNPYAQFGSVLSQQKNPYAVVDDPWGALAANAAQQLVAGVAGGYGQAQVGREMQQIAPLVPQLYSNPMAVSNPGLDDSVFGNLQIAAQNQRSARQKELEDLFLSESVKQNLNPQAPLFQIQAQREKMKYAQELAAMLGVDPSAVNAIPSQAPAGQMPAPDQVFKAPPVAAPTQQAVPQSPIVSNEIPVPNERAEMQKLMASGMPFEDASKQAASNVQKALDFNRQLKLEGVKEEAGLRKLKSEQDIAMQREQKEADKGFDTTIQAIQQMGLSLQDLPNYAGVSGGFEKFLDEQKAAYLPKGSEAQKKAAKGAVAAEMLGGTVPLAIGDLRKELFPGSTSNFEVGILLKPFPEGTKLSETNAALFNNIQKAANIRLVERQFRNWGRSQGWSDKQVQDAYEQSRAKMGGTFLDESGQFKPQFKALANHVGAGLI